MASTFGAATIRVLRDPLTARLPAWRSPRTYVQLDVPSSTDHVTQLLGGRRAVRELTLELTAAEYAALLALAQTQATLTIAGVSQGSCTLLELDAEEEHGVTGGIRARAVFEKAT